LNFIGNIDKIHNTMLKYSYILNSDQKLYVINIFDEEDTEEFDDVKDFMAVSDSLLILFNDGTLIMDSLVMKSSKTIKVKGNVQLLNLELLLIDNKLAAIRENDDELLKIEYF
jgi:hypothetical protein